MIIIIVASIRSIQGLGFGNHRSGGGSCPMRPNSVFSSLTAAGMEGAAWLRLIRDDAVAGAGG